MLPAQHRLRRPAEFELGVRAGVRARHGELVLHLALGADLAAVARVGFVVSKAVGGSVVRHTVTRRLRAIAARHLGVLPPGCLLVVRALPGAAGHTSAQLEESFDTALSRCLERHGVRTGGVRTPGVAV